MASYNDLMKALLRSKNTAMSTLNAFLVEDSPVIRDGLIGALEEMTPVRVIGSADNEGEAVAWLTSHEHGCDLMVIDIFLKSGSGLGVLEEARRLDHDMVLVVLSNYATSDMRRRCFELGADKVFDKSREIDELIDYCGHLTG
jgi:DNA-binding NarL/FixJ family response regulator